MNNLSPKILIFQGGGYDGCFWEWNALFFEQGKLTAKLVTGREGNWAIDALRLVGPFRAIRELNRKSRREQSRPFLIRTQADWEFFCKEWNSGFVRCVARQAGFDVPCDHCGQPFPADEIVHTGYRGNGGVGVEFCDNKCRDCADAEHRDYIANAWKHLPLSDRVDAIHRARREGDDVSIFAARRDQFPAIPAECVWEPEYY